MVSVGGTTAGLDSPSLDSSKKIFLALGYNLAALSFNKN